MASLRPLFALLALAAAGCGGSDFGLSSTPADAATDTAIDALNDAPVADVGSDAAPLDAASDVYDAAQPDAQPDGPTCSPIATEVVSEADGIIIDGACHGANSFLSGPFANVGVGRGLLRFELDDAVTSAFLEGRVVSAHVALARSQDCEGEANCPSSAGVIAAYPLRNDWDEGSSQAYSGADWCRRLGGNPVVDWNAPGADADHGGLAAQVTVDTAQAYLSIPLDPARFSAQWLAGSKLSVLLIPAGATFVFAMRESTKWPPPRLEIQYCQ